MPTDTLPRGDYVFEEEEEEDNSFGIYDRDITYPNQAPPHTHAVEVNHSSINDVIQSYSRSDHDGDYREVLSYENRR